MIRDHVDLHGPFKPVKVFKHASQSLYSKTKGGVDGATDYLSDVSFPFKNLSFEVKFVLRSIFMVTINACIAYRMHKRRDLVAGDDIPTRLIKNLKQSVTNVESVADFIYKAGKELLETSPVVLPAISDQPSIETIQAVGSLTKEELASLQRKITTREPLKFFNSAEGQRLRLSRGNHVPVMNAVDPKTQLPFKRGRRCVLCTREIKSYCTTCRQFMCTSAVGTQRTTCAVTFHQRKKLAPTRDVTRQKRKYSITDEEREARRQRPQKSTDVVEQDDQIDDEVFDPCQDLGASGEPEVLDSDPELMDWEHANETYHSFGVECHIPSSSWAEGNREACIRFLEKFLGRHPGHEIASNHRRRLLDSIPATMPRRSSRHSAAGRP
jgi:hypothetical protein